MPSASQKRRWSVATLYGSRLYYVHASPEEYRRLWRVLAQPNKYMYARLMDTCTLKECRGRKRYKVIEVPEGYLLLSWVPILEAQDLREKPIKLNPLILYIPPGEERIWMQIRKDYVRAQLKKIASAVRHEPFKVYDRKDYKLKHEKAKRYIAYVNAITKAMRDWDKIAYVHPDTCRSYNRKLKRIVKKALMKDMGLRREEARKVMEHLIEWWY